MENPITLRENKKSTIDFDNSLITRETIKIDGVESIQNLEEMFTLNSLQQNPKNFQKINETMLWRFRLGHASLDYLKRLQKTQKALENVKFDESIKQCEVCIMAKMNILPFKETRTTAIRPLQVIHTDTMRPIKPKSHPGQKRFINVCIDDFSRLAKAYPVKTKDESGEAL